MSSSSDSYSFSAPYFKSTAALHGFPAIAWLSAFLLNLFCSINTKQTLKRNKLSQSWPTRVVELVVAEMACRRDDWWPNLAQRLHYEIRCVMQRYVIKANAANPFFSVVGWVSLTSIKFYLTSHWQDHDSRYPHWPLIWSLCWSWLRSRPTSSLSWPSSILISIRRLRDVISSLFSSSLSAVNWVTSRLCCSALYQPR